MRTTTMMALAACTGWLACGGGEAPAPAAPHPGGTSVEVGEADTSSPAPNASEPIMLAVRGIAMTGSDRSRRSLEIDDALSSGDFFAYYVRLDRDAYVYVMQFYADGSAQVLFPESGGQRVAAGQETRLPIDPDGWFQLDDASGTEHLYVIASQQPLERSDPELAELVGSVRVSPRARDRDAAAEPAASATAASAPAPSAAAPPPAPAPVRSLRLTPAVTRMRERAAVMVRVEDGNVVEYRGRGGRDGVGIVHFPFRHQ